MRASAYPECPSQRRTYGTQGAVLSEKSLENRSSRSLFIGLSGHPVIETLDFFVRFWELKARHATGGQPLCASEQIELLSLMQLVTSDLRVPKAGPASRRGSALPAQLIGDGVILPIELRSITAAAILAASGYAVSEGVRVIVRTSDAVRGVDYGLPCTVAWVHRESSASSAATSAVTYTMALVVDGVPTRSHFSSPPDAQARSALSMGRQEPSIS
jgi:hypothetical protein